MKPIQKILVPTDFSPASEEALAYAIYLARALSASLTLFHTVQLPALTGIDPTGLSVWPVTAAGIAADAAERLEEERRRLESQGVKVQVASSDGEAAQSIVSHAHSGGYDLVVMGAHEHGRIARVLLGSVVEKVVRTCECPVFTVRAAEAEQHPPA
jgi:nucleotide-binding universal stress UspA family protein